MPPNPSPILTNRNVSLTGRASTTSANGSRAKAGGRARRGQAIERDRLGRAAGSRPGQYDALALSPSPRLTPRNAQLLRTSRLGLGLGSGIIASIIMLITQSALSLCHASLSWRDCCCTFNTYDIDGRILNGDVGITISTIGLIQLDLIKMIVLNRQQRSTLRSRRPLRIMLRHRTRINQISVECDTRHFLGPSTDDDV